MRTAISPRLATSTLLREAHASSPFASQLGGHRDRHLEQHRREALALRVVAQRRRAAAAAEHAVEHEVDRVEAGQRPAAHAARRGTGSKYALHARGRQLLLDHRHELRPPRDHADVRVVALVAAAPVGEPAQRHRERARPAAAPLPSASSGVPSCAPGSPARDRHARAPRRRRAARAPSHRRLVDEQVEDLDRRRDARAPAEEPGHALRDERHRRVLDARRPRAPPSSGWRTPIFTTASVAVSCRRSGPYVSPAPMTSIEDSVERPEARLCR